MSKRHFLIVPFFLFSLLPSPAWAKKGLEDEMEDFTVAARAFQDGRYDFARQKLDSFLEHYPRSVKFNEAAILLGRSYLELGNSPQSLQILSRLTRAAPLPPQEELEEALYWSGEAYVRLRDYPKAKETFQRLISISSSSEILPYATYSLAWSFQETGDFQRAKETYTKLLRQFPTHPLTEEVRFRLLACLLSLGRLEELQKELELFLADTPASKWEGEAFYLQGELLRLKEEYGRAKGAYQHSLSLASAEEEWRDSAQLQLAWTLYHLQAYEEALVHFKAMGRKEGLFQENGLFGEALIKASQGEFPEALNALDLLLEKFPHGEVASKATLERGRVLYKLNRVPESIEAFQRGLGLTQEEDLRLEAWYALAWAYLRNHAYDEAVSAFQEVIQRSPDIKRKAEFLCYLGDAYLDGGDLQKAIETYRRVTIEHPTAPQADYASLQIGIVFLRARRFQEAGEALQHFLDNFPKSLLRPEGEYQIGMAYFQSGQFALARSHFLNVPLEANRILYESSQFQAAHCLYNLGHYSQALDRFSSLAKEAQPRIASLSQYEIGWCLYQMGNREEAAEAFQRYLSRYPDSEIAADVHFWLAEYYERLKEEEKVTEHLKRLVGRFPSSPLADEALFRWASLLVQSGKGESALARYDQLLADYPESPLTPQVYLEKALLLVSLGKRAQGREVLEEMPLLFSGTEVARLATHRLGSLLKEEGSCAEAIDYFRKAQTGDEYEPNAQLQYEIGSCYEALGDLGQALSAYLRLSSTYPRSTYWVVQADLRSAQILERLGRWDEAIRAYEKLAAWERLEEAAFAKERLRAIQQQAATH